MAWPGQRRGQGGLEGLSPPNIEISPPPNMTNAAPPHMSLPILAYVFSFRGLRLTADNLTLNPSVILTLALMQTNL